MTKKKLGRPFKYGNDRTTMFYMRVPIKHYNYIKQIVEQYLRDKYETKSNIPGV